MLLTGVILILAIFAVIGWRKGVIRLVLSLVSMIVTILAAVIIAPLATTAIRNETNIDENMAQSIYTILSENKEVDQYFSNEQMIPDGINISQAGEHLQNISKAIMEVGDRINLPESLTNAIEAMPESELMTIINEQGQASIKEISLRIIALRLSNIILTAIIYIVIMVVVFIVLRIIIGATGIIRRLPIIKQADKLGGVIVGLIEGHWRLCKGCVVSTFRLKRKDDLWKVTIHEFLHSPCSLRFPLSGLPAAAYPFYSSCIRQYKPILMRTIERFHEYDPALNIILVLPESQQKMSEQVKDLKK